MGDYEKILKRANIENFVNFLIDGEGLEEEKTQEKQSYEKRLLEAIRTVAKGIESLSDDRQKIEKVLDDLTAFYCEVEHIAMEIGVKSGIKLVIEAVKD